MISCSYRRQTVGKQGFHRLATVATTRSRSQNLRHCFRGEGKKHLIDLPERFNDNEQIEDSMDAAMNCFVPDRR